MVNVMFPMDLMEDDWIKTDYLLILPFSPRWHLSQLGTRTGPKKYSKAGEIFKTFKSREPALVLKNIEKLGKYPKCSKAGNPKYSICLHSFYTQGTVQPFSHRTIIHSTYMYSQSTVILAKV